MALTIRPNAHDDKMIKTAAKHLGTATDSKTLLAACDQFLRQRDELLQLENELAKVRRLADNRGRVLERCQNAFTDLMEVK